MHSTIQKALTHLQNAYYVGYFEEMDKVHIPAQCQNPYATQKAIFTSGQPIPHDFSQKLEVLAKQIMGLDKENPANPEPETAPKTTVETLRNLVHQGNIQELLDALDALFEQKPHYSYAQIRQNLQFSLTNGMGIPPQQMQGLLVFLGSNEVKTRLNG